MDERGLRKTIEDGEGKSVIDEAIDTTTNPIYRGPMRRGWGFLATRGTLIAAALTGLPLLMTAPSSALDELPFGSSDCFTWGGSGNSVNYTYRFTNPEGSYSWTAGYDRRPAVDGALNGWEQARNLTAEPLTASRGSGSNSVEIYYSDNIGTSSAVGICSSNAKRIRINSNFYNSSSNSFNRILQHEMGHTMRLRHAGLNAPLEGGFGVMSTCHTPSQSPLPQIRSDDLGALHVHNSGRNAAANGGFEKMGYAWAPLNTQVTQQNFGARTGHRRVRLKRTSTYASYDSAIVVSGPNPQTIAVTAYVKRGNSTQTGLAGLHLWWAKINYKNVVPGSCEVNRFSSGKDENELAPGGIELFEFVKDDTAGPFTSNWQKLIIGGQNVGDQSGIAYAKLIPNFFNSNGSYGYAYFDDVSITVI